MQLVGFPKTGVRKGFVATYGFEDVCKVTVAFALLESGMPSVRACDLTSANWASIAFAIRTAQPMAMLSVEAHALATVGVRGTERQAELERAEIGQGFERTDGGDVFSATSVMVDLTKLTARLGKVLTGDLGPIAGREALMSEPTLREELKVLGLSGSRGD